MHRGYSKAISTALAVVVVIVIIAAVAAGIYLTSKGGSPSSSTTSNSVSTTATTSANVGPLGVFHNGTLTVDDVFCCYGDQFNEYRGGYPFWNTYAVYQPLYFVNGTAQEQANKNQILPGLASSLVISNDNTTFTYNMRHGIYFDYSNGTRADLSTSYIVWTEYYAYFSGLNVNFSSWLAGYPIFNMSTIYTAAGGAGGHCTQLCWGPSVTNMLLKYGVVNPPPQLLAIMQNTNAPWYVTNSSQIVFHLSTPFYYFVTSMSEWWGQIFDAQYVLEHGGWGLFSHPNTYFDHSPTTIPGTGPYLITNAIHSGGGDQFETLTQNPLYWGDNLTQAQILGNRYLDPGHVKTIVIQAVLDDTVRYAQLSTGKVQIAAVEQANWPLIEASPQKFGYFDSPDWAQNMGAMAMNTGKYPTNITTFREAVSHAINLTDIRQKVYFGQASSTYVGPEYPAWPQYYNVSGSLHVPTYDLTLAKQLLYQAVGNKTLPPMNFAVQSTCSSCIAVATIVQSDLAQIGITINIQALSVAQYGPPSMVGYQSWSADRQIAPQAANFDWVGSGTYAPDLLNPADNWTTLVSCTSNGNNFANYCNTTVQTAVNDWFNGASDSQLRSDIGKAEVQLQVDQPYVYFGVLKLWYGGGSIAYNNQVVKGFLVEPLWSGFDTAPIVNTVTFVS